MRDTSGNAAPSPVETVAARRLRRTVRMARLSGWSLIIFGGLSALVCLFDPLSAGMAVSLAALICGILERRFCGQLARRHARAPFRLAWNQLALGAAISLYGLWQLLQVNAGAVRKTLRGPDVAPLLSMLDPVAVNALETLIPQVLIALYVGVILAALLGCGGMALYYYRRRYTIE